MASARRRARSSRRSEFGPGANNSPAVARPEALHMGKLVYPDPFAVTNGPAPPAKDARAKVAPPVQYHTDDPDGPLAEEIEPADCPVNGSALWRRLRRTLLFWRAVRDVVQVSVFGPAVVAPGQSARLSVYLHTPDTTESVRTLSRAFHHDSELIGTGYVSREVARETTLAVHIGVVNAGVSKSLLTFVWRGQPHLLVFDLHVPWESPAGPAPGLVSVGRDNVRIGKTAFRLMLLPRK